MVKNVGSSYTLENMASSNTEKSLYMSTPSSFVTVCPYSYIVCFNKGYLMEVLPIVSWSKFAVFQCYRRRKLEYIFTAFLFHDESVQACTIACHLIPLGFVTYALFGQCIFDLT